MSTESLNDIMFFLLLFFLIISTMANPNVIKLMLPKSANNEQAIKVPVNLSVTRTTSTPSTTSPCPSTSWNPPCRMPSTAWTTPRWC